MAYRDEHPLPVITVEAKAKVKARHSEAITCYLKWRDDNPKARFEQQVKMFDLFVDTAKLRETVGK